MLWMCLCALLHTMMMMMMMVYAYTHRIASHSCDSQRCWPLSHLYTFVFMRLGGVAWRCLHADLSLLFTENANENIQSWRFYNCSKRKWNALWLEWDEACFCFVCIAAVDFVLVVGIAFYDQRWEKCTLRTMSSDFANLFSTNKYLALILAVFFLKFFPIRFRSFRAAIVYFFFLQRLKTTLTYSIDLYRHDNRSKWKAKKIHRK